MYFLTVHFETCGLPDTHSPIVLDAVLFDENYTLVDRFYALVKPYDHFQWDDSANGVHYLNRALVNEWGTDYITTANNFKEWIKKYDQPIELICWDAHTTAINCAYFTPNGTQYFLGCDKLLLRDAIDMRQVLRFYTHNFVSMPKVLESWNVIQDQTLWGQVGNVRSRGMAHKLYLIFVTMKGAQ